MQKENRYEGIRTVRPNRLKPRGIIILVLIGILLLALALYHIPWPEQLDMRMSGAEVDAHGNVIAEGDFIIKGWRYRYLFQDDRIELTHLEVPNLDIDRVFPSQTTAARLWSMSWTDGVLSAHTTLQLASKGNFDITDIQPFHIYTTEEYEFFIFNAWGSRRYFICSTEAPTDYSQILERVGLLED